ncbi:hypothetical protein WFU28_000003 [Listeria monocytogenes]
MMGNKENGNEISVWGKFGFFALVFLPFVLLLICNQSWQYAAVGLAASAICILICIIDNFSFFKFGKDGLEFKKAAQKVETTLYEISDLVNDYLFLTLKNANKIGVNDIDESVEEVKRYESIARKNNIKNLEIITQIEKFKVNILLEILGRIHENMGEISQSSVRSNKPVFPLWDKNYKKNKKLIEPNELSSEVQKFKEFYKDDEHIKDVEQHTSHYEEIENHVDFYKKYYSFLTA